MITPLRIPGRRHARLTRHAIERICEREITPEEIAAVFASASGLLDAIDRNKAGRVRIHHLGITLIVAPGRCVVSAWRGR